MLSRTPCVSLVYPSSAGRTPSHLVITVPADVLTEARCFRWCWESDYWSAASSFLYFARSFLMLGYAGLSIITHKWGLVPGRAWNLVYNQFISSQTTLCKHTCCSYAKKNNQVRSYFCICHDSSAVVAYAKIWPDLIIKYRIRAKRTFSHELIGRMKKGSRAASLAGQSKIAVTQSCGGRAVGETIHRKQAHT